MIRHHCYITLSIVFLSLSACIEQYDLKLPEKNIKKYVVSGRVTDQEGYQTVSLSIASQVNNPAFVPLTNCQVKIIDNNKNEFIMEEFKDGNYRVWIEKEYLKSGNSYKIDITTADGIKIQSDNDYMMDCPEIDTVYYKREDILTRNPEKPKQGLQFYIDYKGTGTNCKYIKWEIKETWEYHAQYPIEWYYDEKYYRRWPPDFSLYICWQKKSINEIFTLSTINLKENSSILNPLHFVDNTTSRLAYLYSILINQFSLSEPVHYYWDQLRTNSNEQGDLFAKQPLSIKGNLYNISNPANEVLGFFYATSVKQKRIFINGDSLDDLELNYNTFCPAPAFLEKGEPLEDVDEYPIFFLYDFGVPRIIKDHCVDCRLLGGDTIKPAFWPY